MKNAQWIMTYLLGIESNGKHAPTETMRSLMAEVIELREQLENAEFLMRMAGLIPGPMQDSFNRASLAAQDILEKTAQ